MRHLGLLLLGAVVLISCTACRGARVRGPRVVPRVMPVVARGVSSSQSDQGSAQSAESLAIEAEKSRLQTAEMSLTASESQIESLQREIRSLEQQMQFGQSVNRYYYESLVDRHNNLASDYNLRLTFHKQAVADLNRRIDAYNARL